MEDMIGHILRKNRTLISFPTSTVRTSMVTRPKETRDCFELKKKIVKQH